MQPTVILLHLTRAGSHYDWLIANPNDPDGLLWTARIQTGPWAWREMQRFALEPIHPHRRLYLSYEGPLGEGHGRAQRIDAGHVEPLQWTTFPQKLNVHLTQFTGQLTISQPHADAATLIAQVAA